MCANLVFCIFVPCGVNEEKQVQRVFSNELTAVAHFSE